MRLHHFFFFFWLCCRAEEKNQIKYDSLETPLQISNVVRKSDVMGGYLKVEVSVTLFNPSENDAYAWVFSFDRDEDIGNFHAQNEKVSRMLTSIPVVNAFDNRYDESDLRRTSNKFFVIKDEENFSLFSHPDICTIIHQDFPNSIVDVMRCFTKNSIASGARPLIKKNSSETFVVQYARRNFYSMEPPAIDLFGTQYLKLSDTARIATFYPSKTQTSAWRFSKKSPVVEYSGSLSQLKTGQVFITDPEISDLEEDVHFVYSHFHPVSHFEKVTRELEVYSTGFSTFREHYDLVNDGVPLKGEFNREEVGKKLNSVMGHYRIPGSVVPQDTPVLFELEANLHEASSNFKIFDDIGNVSSSHAFREKNKMILQFEPRYPLLGDWKYNWNMEFDVPNEAFHQTSENNFGKVLAVTIPPSWNSIMTKNLEFRVILPPFSHSVTIASHIYPSNFKQTKDAVQRPILEFNFENLIFEGRHFSEKTIRIQYQYFSWGTSLWRIFHYSLIALFTSAICFLSSRIFKWFNISTDVELELAAMETGIEDGCQKMLEFIENEAENNEIFVQSIIEGNELDMEKFTESFETSLVKTNSFLEESKNEFLKDVLQDLRSMHQAVIVLSKALRANKFRIDKNISSIAGVYEMMLSSVIQCVAEFSNTLSF
eukprot:GHVP01013676.1.p2 GENE.GHVP01013676.1~~GHVP01013676.1.p2  ORF type:complete len:655 (+),score=133.17 GHVP01013676.1:2282-4246(+)